MIYAILVFAMTMPSAGFLQGVNNAKLEELFVAAMTAAARCKADETDTTRKEACANLVKLRGILEQERTFRSEVVIPMCNAAASKAVAKATIAAERSNPSGVVDLVVLHEAGQVIQQADALLKAYTPTFKAYRKQAFVVAKEGACSP